MVNIYLVGFMGSGKTSAGRLLARHLDAHFLDLDELLVERFGCTIPEVFARHGEASFRTAETDELRHLAAREGRVVATGGGAFVDETNRRIIEASGISVYLDLPWVVLQKRLAGDNADRPLFRNEDQARRLFEARLPHYRRATFTIALSGGEEPEEVARIVAEAVQEALCAT